MADLSEAQNERLRRAVWEHRRRTGISLDALAEKIGIKAPSLSRFVNRHGGAAFATASGFARLVGQSVESLIGPPEARPGENLFTVVATEGPTDAACFRMLAATFVLNLRRMHGLEAWIATNPFAGLTVAKLAEAMQAFDAIPSKKAKGDGSLEWWSAFLAAYIPSERTPTPGPVSMKRNRV